MTELSEANIKLPDHYRFKTIQVNGQNHLFRYLPSDTINAENLLHLQQEYQRLIKLDHPGVLKVQEQHLQLDEPGLQYEDFSEFTLEALCLSSELPLTSILTIITQLVETLDYLHQNQIIHGRLSASHILVDANNLICKLFYLQQRLPEPFQYDTDIHYLAPEQSGQTGFTTDYRADYYALGILLYRLLSNRFPFEGTQTSHILHCHLAEPPAPLYLVQPSLPRVLSDIVSKLLAKQPDKRYQSAQGLLSDLHSCLQIINSHRVSRDFEVGQADIPERFLLPQKLYGRKNILHQLNSNYDYCCQGHQNIVLLKGNAGVGKTALIEHFSMGLKNQAWFARGKFDQILSDQPYSALVQALRQLVKIILAQHSDNLAEWGQRIQQKLKNNAQIVVAAIPDLELIIGTQPPITALTGEDAQIRFIQTFRDFLSLFCSEKNPLVLFIDDMQWADPASIYQMKQLFSQNSEQPYLMFIGAFRDNELDNNSIFPDLMSSLKDSTIENKVIEINALNENQVAQLVADALYMTKEQVRDLSDIVLEKTAGNAFFVYEFLRSLYSQRLLEFDSTNRQWRWSIKAISDLQISENVAELLSNRLSTLPTKVQLLLAYAGIMGNSFSSQILARISDTSLPECEELLEHAVHAGVIQKVSGWLRQHPILSADYRFCHDRLQQSSMGQSIQTKISKIHLHIAEEILKATHKKDFDSQQFTITQHLNAAYPLTAQNFDGLQLTKLNYQAALKAKQSTAYELYNKLLKFSLETLPIDAWQKDYEFCINFYLETAESAYLCSDFDLLEKICDLAIGKAQNKLDKVRFYEVKVNAYLSDAQLNRALQAGMEALHILGRGFSGTGKVTVVKSFLEAHWHLRGKSLHQLERLPLATDPQILLVLRIMSNLMYAALANKPELLSILAFKQITLCVQYGRTETTPYCFATYGIFLCAVLHDVKKGTEFGKLAQALLDRMPGDSRKAGPLLLIHAIIQPHSRHAREALPFLYKGYLNGLKTSDALNANLCAQTRCGIMLLTGVNLNELVREITEAKKALTPQKNNAATHLFNLYLQIASNLIDCVENPYLIEGSHFKESELIPHFEKMNDGFILQSIYHFKMILCYSFHEYKDAMIYAKKWQQYKDSATGIVSTPSCYFFDSLIHLANYPKASIGEKIRIRTHVFSNQIAIKRWCKNAPMNHMHRFYLIEAELHWINGCHLKAMSLFDKAIAFAKEQEYIYEIAITCERAGMFYIEQEMPHVARLYIQQAKSYAMRWGANASVIHFQKVYADLLGNETQEISDAQEFQLTINSGGWQLDMEAILKASQAISSQVDLQGLLKTLLELAAQHAAAQRAAFLLADKDKLTLEAEFSLNSGYQAISSKPLQDVSNLPKQLLRYVARTSSPVLLDNAIDSNLFQYDSYIQEKKPRAILCVPIVHQNQLAGLLYLENNTGSNFGAQKQEVLRLLSTQCAVAVHNARLYDSLRNSEEEYRSLYENAIQGIFRCTAQWTILSTNTAMAKMLGYEDSYQLIHNIPFLGSQIICDDNDLKKINQTLVNQGKLTSYETRCFQKDGSIFWVAISCRKTAHNDNIYYEGTITDITERIEKQNAEQHQKDAEQASQAKSNFLATMSHEIRTPLNGILGMSEILSGTQLTNEQQQFLANISKSGRNLLEIINDILDYSKLEAGSQDFESVNFSLKALLAEVTSAMQPLARTKDLQLEVVFKQTELDWVKGDSRSIRQILLNLISNAIKFTDKGLIQIRLSSIHQEEIRLRVEICDTGPGISEGLENQLFSRFSQLDSSISRRFGGTGLGLAICKGLLDAQQGDIGYFNNSGAGSTFWFEIPLLPGIKQVSTKQVLPAKGPGQNILLVEDEPINQQVACNLLNKLGHKVQLCSSGLAAIMAVKEQTPDLILMDIHMPDMDGVEATRQIREFSPHVPIIALTASVTRQEQQRYLSSGMQAVIAKPFTLSILNQAINENRTEGAEMQGIDNAASESGDNMNSLLNIDLIQEQSSLLTKEEFFPLLEQFVSTGKQRLNQLQDAANTRDNKALLDLSHTQKGVSLLMGASALGEISGQMEAHAKAGDIDQCLAAFTVYEVIAHESFDAIEEYLKSH